MPLPVVDVILPSALAGQSNGKLPASLLQETPGLAGGPIVRLLEVSTRAWRALTSAALQAGHTLKATSAADSYRSYQVQEIVFRTRYTTTYLAGRPSKVWQGVRWYQKPNTAIAAVPGTSNHGWGLAVDIGEERDGDAGTESIDAATVSWLVAHADDFGFSAEVQSEPWHWRYFAGDDIPDAVIDYEEGAMPTDKQHQEALKAAGHYDGAIDGVWGPKSQAALTAAYRSAGPAGPAGPAGAPGAPGKTPTEVRIDTLAAVTKSE